MFPIRIEYPFLEKLHWLLLVSLLLSSALTISLLFRWFRGQTTASKLSGKPWIGIQLCIGLSLAAFHALLWNLYLSSQPRNRFDLAIYWLTLAGGISAWLIMRQLSARGKNNRTAVDLTFSAVQSLGLGVCLQLFAIPAERQDWVILPPGTLSIYADQVAVTDRGNRIHLYQRELTHQEFGDYVQLSRNQIAELIKHAMLKAEPQPNTNCHGWIFSSGEFILRNEDVELILADNCYWQADLPALDDVVIYRDSSGEIIHTGKVCGFLNSYGVLVESKWGIDGTYVHLVDQQPYSQFFEFWRSNRRGHALNILSPDQALAQSSAVKHSESLGSLED